MQIDGNLWPPLKGIQDGEYKLVRTLEALSCFGNPQNELTNIIHIGGTNGKGSTVSFVKNILNAHGFTTNVYTSPHLVTVNERFQIHSKDISNQALQRYTEEVFFTLKKHNLENTLTYFEGLTVVAFYIFAKEKADFNILEVGLGGRFDATNVSNHTLISIITSISLDHQDYLGNTVELIATEKAEIIKPNSMTAIGVQSKNSLYEIFQNKAKSVNSQIEFCKTLQSVTPQIDASYQKQNANLALLAIKMIGKRLDINFDIAKSIDAIAQTKWAGRLQKTHIKTINRDIIIDCAHNIDGISQFLEYIKGLSGGTLIIAMLKRKFTTEISNILHAFLHENKGFKIITTNFEDADECLPADEFAHHVTHPNCTHSNVIKEAFALSQNAENIFLCGSIHFVGFVMHTSS
jgi:dihydrofolate synthase/folylpolyglutamate synthase